MRVGIGELGRGQGEREGLLLFIERRRKSDAQMPAASLLRSVLQTLILSKDQIVYIFVFPSALNSRRRSKVLLPLAWTSW